jgi:hypothetical protein
MCVSLYSRVLLSVYRTDVYVCPGTLVCLFLSVAQMCMCVLVLSCAAFGLSHRCVGVSWYSRGCFRSIAQMCMVHRRRCPDYACSGRPCVSVCVCVCVCELLLPPHNWLFTAIEIRDVIKSELRRASLNKIQMKCVMWLLQFWDITSCSLLKINRRFGGTYLLHLQGRISPAKYQSERKE